MGRRTILLTRPEGRNEELAVRLRSLGYDVVICPLIRTEALGGEPVDLAAFDWVIVTSATGARELSRRATGRPKRVAAIGRATAEAWGGPVDLVPAVSTQEGLLAELPRPPGRVLVAAAESARRTITDELGADFLALYRTVELRPDPLPRADLVVLASASAARAFARLELDIPAVSIGPQTTAAARAGGVRVAVEAREHDTAGVLAAIATLGS